MLSLYNTFVWAWCRELTYQYNVLVIKFISISKVTVIDLNLYNDNGRLCIHITPAKWKICIESEYSKRHRYFYGIYGLTIFAQSKWWFYFIFYLSLVRSKLIWPEYNVEAKVEGARDYHSFGVTYQLVKTFEIKFLYIYS